MCTTQILFHCEQEEYSWYCRCRGCVCYNLLHANSFHLNCETQSELRTKCLHCSAWNSWIEKNGKFICVTLLTQMTDLWLIAQKCATFARTGSQGDASASSAPHGNDGKIVYFQTSPV